MKRFVLATAALLSLGGQIALAEPVTQGAISVDHAWTRATPPAAKTGGGFADITNSGEQDDRLIAVSSPVTDRVELHEMSMKDGVMVMREKENGIELPAGETTSLAPGGLHIMFMNLKGPFKKGETIPVTLTFEKAGELSLDLSVEKIGAKGMEGHGDMAHGDMKHGDMAHGDMDHSKMKMGTDASSN